MWHSQRVASLVLPGYRSVRSLFDAHARLSLTLFALSVALGTAGCQYLTEFDTAEYADGIRFDGVNDSFHRVWWKPPPNGQIRCPIVVHLPGGDIDDTHFTSPEAMEKLGGVVRNKHEDSLDIVVQRDGAFIVTSYQKRTLAMLGVSGEKITVNGKTIKIPISKAELFRVFGQPVEYKTYRPKSF